MTATSQTEQTSSQCTDPTGTCSEWAEIYQTVSNMKPGKYITSVYARALQISGTSPCDLRLFIGPEAAGAVLAQFPTATDGFVDYSVERTLKILSVNIDYFTLRCECPVGTFGTVIVDQVSLIFEG